MIKVKVIGSQSWWQTTVFPDTPKFEAGGSQVRDACVLLPCPWIVPWA